MNVGKTKFMPFDQGKTDSIQINDGTKLEEVRDFEYLGVWMESSAKDIKQHKGAGWKACSKLTKIWKSSLPSQEDSSLDCLKQLSSQYCYMAVQRRQLCSK